MHLEFPSSLTAKGWKSSLKLQSSSEEKKKCGEEINEMTKYARLVYTKITYFN